MKEKHKWCKYTQMKIYNIIILINLITSISRNSDVIKI